MNRREVLVMVTCGASLIALLTPVLADIGDTRDRQTSVNNLRRLHGANVCYANDWNDRQWTGGRYDLGKYGGNCDFFAEWTGVEHPPVFAGFDEDGGGWAWWIELGSICRATYPMAFDASYPLGSYMMPNMQGLHDYIESDRHYDPVYFMPEETRAQTYLAEAFEGESEFVYTPPYSWVPPSYTFSPAAMWHPDVMQPVADGGWQNPLGVADHLFAAPTVSQVQYPDLKTRMIEQWWLRHAPGTCNHGMDAPGLFYSDKCTPYYFNQGASARPLTLFFDGSISALRTGDVDDDDAQVLKGTGGVDGLWSRDTPFGALGYYGDFSHDGTIVSHHVLTTGGILGRDRLNR